MTENQTPDAFEAALAANADELTAGVTAPVEEVVAEVISIDAPVDDLALASDEDGDLESLPQAVRVHLQTAVTRVGHLPAAPAIVPLLAPQLT